MLLNRVPTRSPLGASVWKGSARTPKVGIEKRALKDGSEVMKKELNKWLDKAAALEAKEDQGSDKAIESKKQTTVRRLGKWLRKTWNKVLSFGDGQDGENKDDCEPTDDNDNKSSRREAIVKEQYGGDASQAFRMHSG